MSVERPSQATTRFDAAEFSRLWILAVGTYGVGDVVTTIAVMRFSATVTEANALLRLLVDAFGLSGLVSLKLVVFLACLAVSLAGVRDGDRFLYYVPPVVLALVGGFTTAFNLRLLVG